MKFFDPTPGAMAALGQTVAELPAIQARLVERHAELQHGDRVAHQDQIAGGRVQLAVAATLPDEVRGIGLFNPREVHTGVGRISTGLGCPHLHTDPDFLGIMLAFRVAGRRVDFLGINDPTSPTDTAEEFVAVLAATAEAAGVDVPFGKVGALDLGNFTAAQLKMFETLRERLGLKRATQIYLHIVKQTARTWTSSSAYQQYWTGIVRLGDTLGKFTLVPTEAEDRHRSVAPGERYFADDWRVRNAAADISFGLFWIPYVSDTETSVERLTDAWAEKQRVEIGRVTFLRADPDAHRSKLFGLLAAEMGANVANWIDDRSPAGAGPKVPATRFSAARSLAYRESQRGRAALPEALYESVFDSGEISPELAAELIRRYRAKRAAGHAAPNLGDIGD